MCNRIYSHIIHFTHFMIFFQAQIPVPPRLGTWILHHWHDPIWAIWLAEVSKFHQHHDRIIPPNLTQHHPTNVNTQWIHCPQIVCNYPTSTTAFPYSWWNRCQCQCNAPDNIQRTSRGPINFCGQPSLYPVQSADLDNCPKGSVAHVWHIQLWAIAVCKLLSQTKVAIVTTNIRLVIIENIV